MSILLDQVTGAIYYVTQTIGNQNCPTDQECHTLSYYINNITLPSNVALLFINGEHIINEHEGLQIKGLNNVALVGQGQWVQGFHWSVMQSSVIIKCTYNTQLAINVSATTSIQIHGLTFANCYRGIFITSVSDVYFNNLSVQNSSKFGLWINNTATVTIDSCSFSQNGANVIMNLVKTVRISYSNFTFGCCYCNCSGFSIQTVDISNSSSTNVTIEITGCLVYSNNGSTVGGANVYSTIRGSLTLIIQNTIFKNNNGNKGNEGLGVHVSVDGHSYIFISGVRFLYNKCTGAATIHTGSGGALLFVQSGSQNTLTITNSTFIENYQNGLHLSLQEKHLILTFIKNTTFCLNFGVGGLVGGAFIYIISNYYSANVSLFILNTKFDSNTGVALRIHGDFTLTMVDVYVTKTVSITDSPTSQDIEGALQLICLGLHEGLSLSNVHVTNNNMAGVWIEGCQVLFAVKPSIIANKSPGNGGGIYAKSNSILSSLNATVHFINNTATQYGGAIYSTANLVSTFSNQLLYYGIDCTFYYFVATFSDNYAQIAGNDIYGGYYYGEAILPYFNDVVKCNYHNLQSVACFSKILSSSSISSAPLGACICINNSYIDCTQRLLDKEAYPGQTITLSLVTVGMCGGISPGSIVTKGTSVSLKLDEADQITDIHCKNFTYQVKANTTTTEGKITIETSGSLHLNGSILTINITLLPCPLGLVLDNSLGTCVCDDIINVVKPQCNISWMPYPIKRSGNNWLSYNNKFNCFIAHMDVY